jgi:hypothetical protein
VPPPLGDRNRGVHPVLSSLEGDDGDGYSDGDNDDDSSDDDDDDDDDDDNYMSSDDDDDDVSDDADDVLYYDPDKAKSNVDVPDFASNYEAVVIDDGSSDKPEMIPWITATGEVRERKKKTPKKTKPFFETTNVLTEKELFQEIIRNHQNGHIPPDFYPDDKVLEASSVLFDKLHVTMPRSVLKKTLNIIFEKGNKQKPRYKNMMVHVIAISGDPKPLPWLPPLLKEYFFDAPATSKQLDVYDAVLSFPYNVENVNRSVFSSKDVLASAREWITGQNGLYKEKKKKRRPKKDSKNKEGIAIDMNSIMKEGEVRSLLLQQAAAFTTSTVQSAVDKQSGLSTQELHEAREMRNSLAQSLSVPKHRRLYAFLEHKVLRSKACKPSDRAVETLFNSLQKILTNHRPAVSGFFDYLFGDRLTESMRTQLGEDEANYRAFKSHAVLNLALAKTSYERSSKNWNKKGIMDQRLKLEAALEREKKKVEKERRVEKVLESIVNTTSAGASESPTTPLAAGRVQKDHLAKLETTVLFEEGEHGDFIGEAVRGELMERRIMVNNLPIDVTEEELREAFGFCGEIEDARLFNLRPDLDPGEARAKKDKLAKPIPRAGNFWSKEKFKITNKSPVYGMSTFKEQAGVERSTAEHLRIFGLVIRKHCAEIRRCTDEVDTLYLENLPMHYYSLDMEFKLNDILGPAVYVCLGLGEQDFALPSACEVRFRDHNTAAWAREKLVREFALEEGGGGRRGEGEGEEEGGGGAEFCFEDASQEGKIVVNWMKTQHDAELHWTRKVKYTH